MNVKQVLAILVVCSAGLHAQQTFTKADLKEQIDSVSYSIGYDMGKTMRTRDIDIKYAYLAQGIKDGLSEDDSKALISTEGMEKTFGNFQKTQTAKIEKKKAETLAKNKIEGAKFMDSIKVLKDVKALKVDSANTMYYRVITEGKGEIPSETDTVSVNYKGSLINGTVFDASEKHGNKPISFALNRVIKGWTKGLQTMKAGGKSILYIPSGLAYGEREMGGTITPGSTLVFEVELLKISHQSAVKENSQVIEKPKAPQKPSKIKSKLKK